MNIPRGTYRFDLVSGGYIADGATHFGLEGASWNPGWPVVVVARISPESWSASIGAAASPSEREEQTLVHVADTGAKLRGETARHFFPAMDLPYRR